MTDSNAAREPASHQEEARREVGSIPPAPDVDDTQIREVARGVWVIPDGRVPLVPNVGVVVGEERTLVVDVGIGPRNGARVLRAAQEKVGGRSLVVTTTRFHPEPPSSSPLGRT